MSTENKTRLIKFIYFALGIAAIYGTSILLSLDFTTLASILALALVIDNRIDSILTHNAYMIMFNKLMGNKDGTDDNA